LARRVRCARWRLLMPPIVVWVNRVRVGTPDVEAHLQPTVMY